jgi:hypothetical protein
LDELSEEDKLTVARARKAQKFLSQPFFVAEVFTGRSGKFVELEQTIQDFGDLLDGKYDHVPETAFYMQGDIKDVFKAAENMERELAEKKAREAAEAAMNVAAAAPVAEKTEAEVSADKLTDFDIAVKRAEEPLRFYKEFLEYAANKESNIEAAVLLGCPNALEYFAVREEFTRMKQPRASNFNAFLENVPEAGEKRTEAATDIARQSNLKKAAKSATPLSADAVKALYSGSEVTLDDVYVHGASVGAPADRATAADAQKAYDTLKKFASAVGGTVSQGFEQFKAERLLFDPYFAFHAATKGSSSVHFEQWYDVYTAEAQTAAKNLASPKLPYKLYTDAGGNLSIDDWKQEQARKSLPLLGGSKETLSAFGTFLKRSTLTPFYQEYKKLLNL